MKSFTGKFASARGWALLLALLLGAGMLITACGDEEVPAPTTPAPPPPPPPPAPEPEPEPEPEPTGSAAPENLRVSATTTSSITWMWDAVEGVLGYQGQFSPDATFTDTDVTFIIPAPLTSHLITGLDANTPGHFRVRSGVGTAVTDLTFSDWTEAVSGTTAAPPPATALGAPGSVSTSDVQQTSIAVSWSSVDDADHYEVEQQADGGSWADASCGGADNEVDGTSCVASDLDRGTSYNFRVRAIPASSDTTKTVGPWSTSGAVTTSGTPPREPVTGGDDTYEITWESDSSAHAITWTWSRPDDGRIRFLIALVTANSNIRPDCPALTAAQVPGILADNAAGDPPAPGLTTGWYGGPDGLAEYSRTVGTSVNLLSAGVVYRLCVVPTWKQDGAQQYGDVFSAWAATVPRASAAVGDIALGPKVRSDRQQTTAIDWYVEVDQGFTYEVQTISATVGERLPRCGSGTGHPDLTSNGDNDVQRFRLGSGLQTYTTYAACVRTTNDDGQSGWLKLFDPAPPQDPDSGEYSTLPGPPPAASYVGRRNDTNSDLTAGDANWRFSLGTRLPEESGRYEAKVLMWDGLNTAEDNFASAVRPDQSVCSAASPDNYVSLGAVTITEEGGSFLASAATLPSRNATVNTADSAASQTRTIYACVRASLSADENVGSAAPHDATMGPWSVGTATVALKGQQ